MITEMIETKDNDNRNERETKEDDNKLRRFVISKRIVICKLEIFPRTFRIQ